MMEEPLPIDILVITTTLVQEAAVEVPVVLGETQLLHFMGLVVMAVLV